MSEALPAGGTELVEQSGAHPSVSSPALRPASDVDAAPASDTPSADDAAGDHSAGPAEAAEHSSAAAATAAGTAPLPGDNPPADPDTAVDVQDAVMNAEVDAEQPAVALTDAAAPHLQARVDTASPVDTMATDAAPQLDPAATTAVPPLVPEPADDVVHAAPFEAEAAPGGDVLSGEDAGSDSPDEVPLRSEDGLDGQRQGGDAVETVAGVPQAATRDDVGAPAVAIPVEAVHASTDRPGPAGAAPDVPVGAQPSGDARHDGTLLVDHPPPTPVHDDVLAEAPMHGIAAEGGAQEAVEEGVRDPADGGGAGPTVVDVMTHGDAAVHVAGVAAAGPPAPAPARTGRAAAARSKPGKSSGRARRVHAAAEPGAAVAAADGDDGAAGTAAPQPTPTETGMRTRRRGKGSEAQDNGTLFRGYVLEVLGELASPETTLVRDLRVAMERRFGVKLDTFVERKQDVEDACGEFFTSLGFAESR